tara:strand:+ start:153 stop:263 length:111 start_codon:yes stop_codon:yes gene_type:complete
MFVFQKRVAKVSKAVEKNKVLLAGISLQLERSKLTK